MASDDGRSAPATWCSVSIWRGGARSVVTVDPSTTLEELLAKEKLSLGDVYDVSYAPRPLEERQLPLTLEALGWFPSGVIEVREEEEDVEEEDARGPSSFKASTLFEQVKHRFDDAPPTDEGRPRFRVKRGDDARGISAAASKKKETGFRRVDDQRKRAKSKAGETVWHMLAKKHAVGAAGVRDEDRFHLVVDAKEKEDASFYCFFGRATSVAAAVDAIKRDARRDGDVLVVGRTNEALPMTASFADLERNGTLRPFDVVDVKGRRPLQLRDPLMSPPAAVPAAAAAPAETTTPLPEPSEDDDEGPRSSFTVVVKFEARAVTLEGLDPAVSTVADLQRAIAEATGLAPEGQKLVCKAKLADDSSLLHDAGLRSGASIVVLRAAPKKKKRR